VTLIPKGPVNASAHRRFLQITQPGGTVKTLTEKGIASRPHRLVAEWWEDAQRVSMVCVRCHRQVISDDVADGLASFAAAAGCLP
jgi:hypothetical protein